MSKDFRFLRLFLPSFLHHFFILHFPDRLSISNTCSKPICFSFLNKELFGFLYIYRYYFELKIVPSNVLQKFGDIYIYIYSLLLIYDGAFFNSQQVRDVKYFYQKNSFCKLDRALNDLMCIACLPHDKKDISWLGKLIDEGNK